MSARPFTVLEALATELKDTFSEKGHKIKDAIAMDEDFGINNHPKSWLTRNVVQSSIERTAQDQGIEINFKQALDFSIFEPDSNIQHVFRIKKATVSSNGNHRILAPGGSPSSNSVQWGKTEQESLITTIPWVFGYIPLDEEIRIFVAKALGITEGNPAIVLINEPIFLDGAEPDYSDRIFVPNNEDSLELEVDYESQESLFG